MWIATKLLLLMSALPDDIVFFPLFHCRFFRLCISYLSNNKKATSRYILTFIFIVCLGKDKVNIYFACTVYIMYLGKYGTGVTLRISGVYVPVEYTISRSATYHRNIYLLVDFIFAFISFIS